MARGPNLSERGQKINDFNYYLYGESNDVFLVLILDFDY